MSQQQEGVFKRQVVKDLKEAFGHDIDILAPQERARNGVPDLIICLKGHSIKNELKINGEKPTVLQQLKLDYHSRAGGLSMSSTPETWPMHLKLLVEKYGAKK
jgi:hypothetical protein